MGQLIFAGIASLLFGLLFLVSPGILEKLGNSTNKTLMVIDEAIFPIKNIVGIILLLAGGWMLWAVFPYSRLWYINIAAVISLFFGILLLVFPSGLKYLSKLCDSVLLSTDELIMGTRKTVGILLIIAGIYIFYYIYYFSIK